MRDNREYIAAGPADLPVRGTGWDPAEIGFGTGPSFWDEVGKVADHEGLENILDENLVGHPSPRVWLITHEPGRAEFGVAVAMGFARALAAREQAALVLDADDRALALTTWAGRREREGWIDLIRYGTSVLAAGEPLPFEGRQSYLLGVGSFAPTDVMVEEIELLILRLRRQADDILVVAPADGIGALWARAANIRLLCWDRTERPADLIARVARDYAERGVPLDALLGFGVPSAPESVPQTPPAAADATESDADSAPAEADPGAEEPPAGADEGPEEDLEDLLSAFEEVDGAGSVVDRDPGKVVEADTGAEFSGLDAVDVEEGDVQPVEAVPAVGADAGTESQVLPSESDDDEEWVEPYSATRDREEVGRSGTSGVFLFVVSAVAVIVAILGLYWYQYVRVPASELEPPEMAVIQPEPEKPQTDQAAGGPADGDLANADGGDSGHDASPGAAAADSISTGDGRTDTVGTHSGDEMAAPTGTAGAADGEMGTGRAAAGDSVPDAMAAGDMTAADGDSTPNGPAVQEPPAPAFSMEPYRGPVGAAGWALHLYSLPDTNSVEVQVAELRRRGFETEIRAYDLEDKGRWWRIYVGNFASRAAARAAAPLLKEELRTDWAAPTRF